MPCSIGGDVVSRLRVHEISIDFSIKSIDFAIMSIDFGEKSIDFYRRLSREDRESPLDPKRLSVGGNPKPRRTPAEIL